MQTIPPVSVPVTAASSASTLAPSASASSPSAAMDDLPALEHAPGTLGLTDIAKRGTKRPRDGEEQESKEESPAVDASESESSSDEEVEEESSEDEDGEADFDGLDIGGGRGNKNKKPEKEDDGGVARAKFPVVQTIHATAYLGQEVDVRVIANCCINARYQPPSSVRFDFRNPVGVARVYNSGKYVCLGGKSTVDILMIARKVARKIQKIGQNPRFPQFKSIGFHNFSLNNISANAALGYRVNLQALATDPTFSDYTEYEPEQWKGLHYKLPVDPTKSLADLLPSYAYMQQEKNRTEQFSNDEFLNQGKFALQTKGQLNHFAQGMAHNSANSLTSVTKKTGVPLKVPPSLHGQILTATIYANGRLTLTGVRKEQDIIECFRRLWVILQRFAHTAIPDHMAVQPAYPRQFLPGQRRLMKKELLASEEYQKKMATQKAKEAANRRDIKPNIVPPQAPVFVLPRVVPGEQMVLKGNMAAANPNPSVATEPSAVKNEGASAPVAAAPPQPVKAENGVVAPATAAEIKHENGAAAPAPAPAPSAALASKGNTADSAIVLEGLPQGSSAAEDDEVWE